MITFTAVLEKCGAFAIIRLPERASRELPSRGQVITTVTIDGYSIQQVIEPDGRFGHWFKVNKKTLQTISKTIGNTVAISLTPSKYWPEPNVPLDFSKALDAAPSDVQELWKKITPMARWEWIRWVNATNVTETRERRVDVSMQKMKSGKRRPCCFNLASCTDPELAKSGKLIETTD